MTGHRRILALAALAGGIGLAGVAFAQQATPDAPPPPPPGQDQAQGFPMGLLGGPGGPGGERGERGPRGPRIDFAAIDANGDGVLSRDELTARATERLGGADTNGDGALDRAELIAALPAPRDTILMVFAPDPAAERADRILAFMGAGESGRIEIAALSERQVNALLARFDTDRDGAISKAEAEQAQKGPRFHKPRDGEHGPDHGPRDGGRG